MKNINSKVWAACAVTGVLLTGSMAFGETDANGFVRIRPDQVEWKSPFGIGAATSVLAGDPTKPGYYVIRVKFPPHTFSRPHYHPNDRHIVVLQGTWYTGTGNTFDADKTVGLKPGSYMMHPAKQVHWDGAKDDEVILQISGEGPADTIPIKPEDGRFISTK